MSETSHIGHACTTRKIHGLVYLDLQASASVKRKFAQQCCARWPTTAVEVSSVNNVNAYAISVSNYSRKSVGIRIFDIINYFSFVVIFVFSFCVSLVHTTLTRVAISSHVVRERC